jgi:hypothetical protein
LYLADSQQQLQHHSPAISVFILLAVHARQEEQLAEWVVWWNLAEAGLRLGHVLTPPQELQHLLVVEQAHNVEHLRCAVLNVLPQAFGGKNRRVEGDRRVERSTTPSLPQEKS